MGFSIMILRRERKQGGSSTWRNVKTFLWQNKEEAKMSVLQNSVTNRETSDLEMILCRRQPGNLRILKRSCAQRYLKAHQIGQNTSARNVGVIQRWGFEICRSCPEGRLCAEETRHLHYQRGRRGSSDTDA